jgi:hypothetical protein
MTGQPKSCRTGLAVRVGDAAQTIPTMRLLGASQVLTGNGLMMGPRNLNISQW